MKIKFSQISPVGDPAKKAFTLVELLVVIAIIAILAAILFPVFARARANARRSSCQSNLKQMGLAMLQYTQDYDEFFPYALAKISTSQPDGRAWLPSNGPDYWAWPQLLYPYHKSVQVFVCPDSPNGDTAATPVTGHYGVNRDIVPFASSPLPSPTQLSQFEATSKTYLMFDSGYYILLASNVTGPSTNTSGYTYYLPGTSGFTSYTGTALPSNLQSDYTSGRHFSGVNMAFADGHVKWLKSEVVWAEAKKTASTGGLYGAWRPANS